MTKYVSALILVLLMAPAANGALLVTIDGNPVPWDTDVVGTYLGLYTDTPIKRYDNCFMLSGGITMDTTDITFPLGPEVWDWGPEIKEGGGVGVTFVRIAASQFVSPDVGPGDLVANITLSGTGTIFLYDWFLAPPIGSINIVPEPAAIFLLGFGGLALLRKHRRLK